jgi:hypothetical protein
VLVVLVVDLVVLLLLLLIDLGTERLWFSRPDVLAALLRLSCLVHTLNLQGGPGASHPGGSRADARAA